MIDLKESLPLPRSEAMLRAKFFLAAGERLVREGGRKAAARALSEMIQRTMRRTPSAYVADVATDDVQIMMDLMDMLGSGEEGEIPGRSEPWQAVWRRGRREETLNVGRAELHSGGPRFMARNILERLRDASEALGEEGTWPTDEWDRWTVDQLQAAATGEGDHFEGQDLPPEVAARVTGTTLMPRGWQPPPHEGPKEDPVPRCLAELEALCQQATDLLARGGDQREALERATQIERKVARLTHMGSKDHFTYRVAQVLCWLWGVVTVNGLDETFAPCRSLPPVDLHGRVFAPWAMEAATDEVKATMAAPVMTQETQHQIRLLTGRTRMALVERSPDLGPLLNEWIAHQKRVMGATNGTTRRFVDLLTTDERVTFRTLIGRGARREIKRWEHRGVSAMLKADPEAARLAIDDLGRTLRLLWHPLSAFYAPGTDPLGNEFLTLTETQIDLLATLRRWSKRIIGATSIPAVERAQIPALLRSLINGEDPMPNPKLSVSEARKLVAELEKRSAPWVASAKQSQEEAAKLLAEWDAVRSGLSQHDWSAMLTDNQRTTLTALRRVARLGTATAAVAGQGATGTAGVVSPETEDSTEGDTMANANEQKPTIPQQLTADAQEAAWRTAGTQLVKLTRDPLSGLLSRHLGPNDEALRKKIADFLQTEAGTALLSSVLSLALGVLPPGVGGEAAPRLSRELRVKAMADMGDVVADVLMGPLRQVMVTYLQGVPEVDSLLNPTPAQLPAATPSASSQIGSRDTVDSTAG